MTANENYGDEHRRHDWAEIHFCHISRQGEPWSHVGSVTDFPGCPMYLKNEENEGGP